MYIIEDVIKQTRDKDVLEIGCGDGSYTQIIQKYAKSLKSIDLLQMFIDMNIKENSAPNTEFLLMDASNLKFNDKFFDVVFSSSFHEIDHEKQTDMLNEAMRVLKDNGLLIFIDPTEESVTNDLFKVFDPNENHGERIKKSASIMKNYMQQNGYKLLQYETGQIDMVFDDITELDNTMLDWWSDIIIPKDDAERQILVDKIHKTLKGKGLEEKTVIEKIQIYIFRKEELK